MHVFPSLNGAESEKFSGKHTLRSLPRTVLVSHRLCQSSTFLCCCSRSSTVRQGELKSGLPEYIHDAASFSRYLRQLGQQDEIVSWSDVQVTPETWRQRPCRLGQSNARSSRCANFG